jgi:hypothetical protein
VVLPAVEPEEKPDAKEKTPAHQEARAS